MSLAAVFSRAQTGLEAPLVSVEVHLAGGLPALSMVGLPEAAVKESKDRVRAALINAGFDFPARRITVNLAPADLPKEGGRFDLAVALGILAASGQLPKEALAEHEFLGELSLGGELRPVRGVLPGALKARDAGRGLVVPIEHGPEAALANGVQARVAASLLAVCADLCGREPLPVCQAKPPRQRLRRPFRIWPTYVASTKPNAPWKSPPRAVTASCWSDRRVRARACWPLDYRVFCRD